MPILFAYIKKLGRGFSIIVGGYVNVCWRRAYDDDASIQNPYPQKTNRWDEAGQTTAIVGIPNKHSNI
jgi:hypothetical protein